MKIHVRTDIVMQTLIPGDAGEVFKVINKNRSYLRTWLPWVDGTDSPEAVKNVAALWEKERESGTDLVLGIFKSGQYIGNIGLHDIKRSNNSGMIGYWLSENEQGKEIMTDCVRILADYGFSTLSLNRIYIYCAVKNLKSRAVPERLGFVLEGILQDGEFLYGEYFDLAVYGVVKRNWTYSKHNNLRLVFPLPEHKDEALAYRQEYIDCRESHIHGSGGFLQAVDYESWLEKIINMQTTAQPDWVTGSTYFAFAGNTIVGTIQIRHTLNDELINTGGHIGYGVRPSERQKGYAAKMLALALEKCREFGIEKALITCDKDNIASAKTVIKDGGLLENEFIEENGNVIQRYWITL